MGWRRMSWSCRLFVAAAAGMAWCCWMPSAADHAGVQLKVLSPTRVGAGEDGSPCVVFSRAGEGEDWVVLEAVHPFHPEEGRKFSARDFVGQWGGGPSGVRLLRREGGMAELLVSGEGMGKAFRMSVTVLPDEICCPEGGHRGREDRTWWGVRIPFSLPWGY